MSREDPYIVRHDSWPGVGDGQRTTALVNRAASLVVTDFFDQLVLGGWAYHMQIGTESAGVASTTTIADTLVWMLLDQNAGYAMIPLLAEINVDTWTTGTAVEAMLEADKLINRYSSGGTAFTPENLSGGDEHSFNGSGYVGTDITAAAKSAVPDSIELARKTLSEDAIGTAVGSDFPNPILYSVRQRPLIKLTDAASLLVHFGATTADVTGFGVLQVAQIEKAVLE